MFPYKITLSGLVTLCLLGCDGGNNTVSSSSEVAAVSSIAVVSSSVVSSSSVASSSEPSGSSSSIQMPPPVEGISAACLDLVTNPNTNWDESTLGSQQAVVKCLSDSLGRAVGYGAKALGGYDPSGNSNLVVIKKNSGVMPEQQIKDAINSTEHNWIVFDKDDYANGGDIGMYRLHCSNPSVLSALDNASPEECMDHNLWCSNHGVNSSSCLTTFFNQRLNDKNLPIRDEMIVSNTTLDGRGNNAKFIFNGFKVGADSSGQSTNQAVNVIVTHLLMEGAYHEEDHGLDPDLLRMTGESHDIWIHKNTFKYSGDSAFDIKVGAYDATISFNKVVDVVRSSLHGSSDSRVINEQITSTMHHNLFLTSEEFHSTGLPGDKAAGSTGRRTPLIRRGSAHLFNNVFFNYYKDFASVRVGATLLLENNIFLASDVIKTRKNDPQDAFDEWLNNLHKSVVADGYFTSNDGRVAFVKGDCEIDAGFQGLLPTTIGASARDLKMEYSAGSRSTINDYGMVAGQDLIDYVKVTAGKEGEAPFNSPLGKSAAQLLQLSRTPCM